MGAAVALTKTSPHLETLAPETYLLDHCRERKNNFEEKKGIKESAQLHGHAAYNIYYVHTAQ